MNTANGAIMLVEPINESAHAIIPELDHATVETRQDPWPLAMETQTFHSITLRLKLRQHFIRFPCPPKSQTEKQKKKKKKTKNVRSAFNNKNRNPN